MNYAAMLPIPAGTTFSAWATKWVASVSADVQSVVTEPNELSKRNERYASYIPTITTIIAAYRAKGRQVRDGYNTDNPKPERGVREWEEKRDSVTAEYRYTEAFLEKLREDLQTRISVTQSNLNVYRDELKTLHAN